MPQRREPRKIDITKRVFVIYCQESRLQLDAEEKKLVVHTHDQFVA
jgi:hypothetical protein